MAKLSEVTLAPPRERKTSGRSRKAEPAALAEETPCASPPPEPLPTDAAAFWGSSGGDADVVGGFPPTTLSAALPRRLGAFPFWRSSPPLMDTLELIYRAASIAAVDLLATTTAHDPVEDR
ncbi:hypothetical protein JXA88_13650 [Candidatus Fermentibacteria bacterium]|nr:hypothetical protein [Candidatus Fermentibacteria bacterium]